MKFFLKPIDITAYLKATNQKKNNGTINDNCVEYNGNADKNITMEPYLENVELYLSGMLAYHRESGEYQIHFKIKINFTSSKVNNKQLMYWKSYNM